MKKKREGYEIRCSCFNYIYTLVVGLLIKPLYRYAPGNKLIYKKQYQRAITKLSDKVGLEKIRNQAHIYKNEKKQQQKC